MDVKVAQVPANGGVGLACAYHAGHPDGTTSWTMTAIAPPLTPFDQALDAERTRWLRRRFLWFCAVSTVLFLLAHVDTLSLLKSPADRTRHAAEVSLAGVGVSAMLYAIAGWAAWSA